MAIDVSLSSRRISRTHTGSGVAWSDSGACVPTLLSLAFLATIATVEWPTSTTYAVFIPIAVAAGMLLVPRRAMTIFAVLAVMFVLSVAITRSVGAWSVGGVLVMVMLLVAAVDRQHARAGVTPAVGSSMLVDLRERLRAQGRLPVLPSGWNVESCVQPAYGDSFSGDFVVGNCPTPDRFELALVDVSGKGCTAATRSLLLGGAFAGLLGAMEPTRFLPAANDYLMRQGWSEGFATAVHASIDLTSGHFSIGSAGHPSAIHFHAGSRRFTQVSGASGVLLGVMDRQGPGDFVRAEGSLERGDALMFFTDGMIEQPGVDLAQGIDRMLGHADRELMSQMRGAAARICAIGSGGEADDRAVVVVWRD
ncbi:PP2C family protein-serine/threonine phosphatase [Rudaeicoccus suwonensis]|nr:PP2C family protein-serine/threonine phosphatase [Rudaeicoccus suwonensis]